MSGKSIRNRIFSYSLIVYILPLVITGILFVPYFITTFYNDQIDNFDKTTDQISALITQFFESRVSEMKLLATDPIFYKENISNDNKREVLFKLQKLHYYYDDISLINNNGIVVSSTHYNYKGEWTKNRWFLQALEGKTMISDAHIVSQPFHVAVQIMAPVYDDESNVIAVISGQIDLKFHYSEPH